MPKLYEYLGMIFLFYSRDHLPMHLHVRYQECEEVAELIFTKQQLIRIRWRSAPGFSDLPPRKKRQAEELIRSRHQDISMKWAIFFNTGKRSPPEQITEL